MPWYDRLKPAAYTAPSGTRMEFTYENVSRTTTKNTSAYTFPDTDGTYIQDLGHEGRKHPLRVIFHGDNHDFESKDFETLLLEKGEGKLEHPMYGVVDVVPFGTIARRDDLKTAANQSIIDVAFWETIGLIYPTSKTDPASDVVAGVEAYNTTVATEFSEKMSLDTVAEQYTLQSRYTELLDLAKAELQLIADKQDNVRRQFNTIESSITTGLSTFIGDPLTLAFQTTLLLQSPARALSSILARLNAYSSLVAGLISGDGAVGRSNNDFRTNDLYVSTYVTGAILSVVNHQFSTKNEALDAAESVLSLFDDVTVWRDANLTALSEIDSGGSYSKLQHSVALTAGFLVEISFTLLQERNITLDRPRNIIDLTGELYGTTDDKLDFLITSNELTGSEILELPRGKTIAYYV